MPREELLELLANLDDPLGLFWLFPLTLLPLQCTPMQLALIRALTEESEVN